MSGMAGAGALHNVWIAINEFFDLIFVNSIFYEFIKDIITASSKNAEVQSR